MYTPLHHAAVDAQAAVALGNQLGLMMDADRAIPGTVGVLSQMASQKAGSTAPSRLEGQGAAAAGKRVSNRALAARTRLGTTVSDTHAFASIGLPLQAVTPPSAGTPLARPTRC